jgi:hypothetical protein
MRGMGTMRKKWVCDRSEIRFESRRRIRICRASGQLHCGADVHFERRQRALMAAGWLHTFNLCATAAIGKKLKQIKWLMVVRRHELDKKTAV